MVPIPPPEEAPLTPVPPAAPAPVVPIAKEPAKKELPSWFDPSWKPIRKFKIEEQQFPISHWAKLPDEEEPRSIPKPEPAIEVELKTEPEPTMSVEEAQKYLESLPEEPHLG